MTVGELVEAAERGPMMTSYETALKDLGIWDAEVYEVEAGYGDCGEHVWHGAYGGWPSDLVIPCEWGSRKRVKVIVIPQEEE